jgi:hypothetical protein
MTKRKCKICRKSFPLNRDWQKYCSPRCRNEAKNKNAKIWREKKLQVKIKNLTLHKIKDKKLYSDAYENIINYLGVGKQRHVSWTKLYYESKLGDRTFFDLFINRLCGLGVLKKENGGYCLTKRHRFEPLRLRQNKLITNTNLECVLFRSLKGYDISYYHPRIDNDYLRYSLDKLDEKFKEIEEHLIKAESIFISILNLSREKYLGELWKNEILNNKKISVLTKFDFTVDTIIQDLVPHYFVTSWKTPYELKKILSYIKNCAFENYLKMKYPNINKREINELYNNIEKEHKEKKNFFEKLLSEIKKILDPGILEHMLVVDMLSISTFGSEELIKKKLIQQISFSSDESIRKQMECLKETTNDKDYNHLYEKESVNEYKPEPKNDNVYISTPFFKKFLGAFEQDFKHIGLKPKNLELFYERLDEMAEIIKIPALPEKLNSLL